MPLSWAELNWDKKLRKIKNYQKWLAWSPLSGYVTKSLLQRQFVVKNPLLLLGPQNPLQMSLLRENKDELRALAYTKILASVIFMTCQTYISVSYIEKIYWFSPGFIKKFNFNKVPLDYMSPPFDAKQCGHHRCKIDWIFQRETSPFDLTTRNRTWISVKSAISHWVHVLQR